MWEGGEEFKPDWDMFYMSQAYLIAQRSVDENTVHGACLVSKDHRLLSIGYNGPIRDSWPKTKDLKKRPSKYYLMIHAEENCIINYHGSHSDLDGSTMYITGEPCHRCLRMILQKGVSRIIYGGVGSKCVDKEDEKAKELIIRSLCYQPVLGGDVEAKVRGPNVFHLKDSGKKTKEILQRAIDYIDYKENDNG